MNDINDNCAAVAATAFCPDMKLALNCVILLYFGHLTSLRFQLKLKLNRNMFNTQSVHIALTHSYSVHCTYYAAISELAATIEKMLVKFSVTEVKCVYDDAMFSNNDDWRKKKRRATVAVQHGKFPNA